MKGQVYKGPNPGKAIPVATNNPPAYASQTSKPKGQSINNFGAGNRPQSKRTLVPIPSNMNNYDPGALN